MTVMISTVRIASLTGGRQGRAPRRDVADIREVKHQFSRNQIYVPISSARNSPRITRFLGNTGGREIVAFSDTPVPEFPRNSWNSTYFIDAPPVCPVSRSPCVLTLLLTYF